MCNAMLIILTSKLHHQFASHYAIISSFFSSLTRIFRLRAFLCLYESLLYSTIHLHIKLLLNTLFVRAWIFGKFLFLVGYLCFFFPPFFWNESCRALGIILFFNFVSQLY